MPTREFDIVAIDVGDDVHEALGIVSEGGSQKRPYRKFGSNRYFTTDLDRTIDMAPAIALAGDNESLSTRCSPDLIVSMKDGQPGQETHPRCIDDLGQARGQEDTVDRHGGAVPENVERTVEPDVTEPGIENRRWANAPAQVWPSADSCLIK